MTSKMMNYRKWWRAQADLIQRWERFYGSEIVDKKINAKVRLMESTCSPSVTSVEILAGVERLVPYTSDSEDSD